MNQILLPLDKVRSQIHNADLLLFRRRGLISTYGRGEHSHAGLAAWWGEELMCLEMVQFGGGRAVTLDSQVTRWPGQWDVFTPTPHLDPERETKIVHAMRKFCGTRYGWWNVFRAGLVHFPVVRLFVSAEIDDAVGNGTFPPVCSEAIARVYRAEDMDLVPMLADRLTEPADLARSGLLRYKFTLC